MDFNQSTSKLRAKGVNSGVKKKEHRRKKTNRWPQLSPVGHHNKVLLPVLHEDPLKVIELLDVHIQRAWIMAMEVPKGNYNNEIRKGQKKENEEEKKKEEKGQTLLHFSYQ